MMVLVYLKPLLKPPSKKTSSPQNGQMMVLKHNNNNHNNLLKNNWELLTELLQMIGVHNKTLINHQQHKDLLEVTKIGVMVVIINKDNNTNKLKVDSNMMQTLWMNGTIKMTKSKFL